MNKFSNFWLKYSKNKAAVAGLIVFMLIVICVIVFTLKLDYEADAITQDIMNRRLPPSAEHWFGTDVYGRDLFARVIFGAWFSFGISFISVIIAAILGSILGITAGYFGGIIENVLMRCIDVLLAIPSILLAIVIVAAFGSSVVHLTLALAISMTPRFSRISRSAVLPLRELEYIQAAKASGASSLQIILQHILPNAFGPILVQATLNVSSVILSVAGLSFIGLGIAAPAPEWGTLLFEGKAKMLTQPYLVIIPGICIILLSLSINLIGDGLRDVLDPRSKK